ncbi:hypothetical protein PG994_007173 [Apiospora phragmitis]|uniref:Uncharacterized protein n=1 Tax=Apiospora phragmitis TaxID=2905665 RepID=A0ABR1V2N8_9PEZI
MQGTKYVGIVALEEELHDCVDIHEGVVEGHEMHPRDQAVVVPLGVDRRHRWVSLVGLPTAWAGRFLGMGWGRIAGRAAVDEAEALLDGLCFGG